MRLLAWFALPVFLAGAVGSIRGRLRAWFSGLVGGRRVNAALVRGRRGLELRGSLVGLSPKAHIRRTE
jgi:hypothetical protein